MVLKPVDFSEHRSRSPVSSAVCVRVKIPQQTACPEVSVCQVLIPAKTSHCLELPLLKIHHPVDLIRRPPRALEIVRLRKLQSLRAQLQHFLFHNPIGQILLSPLPKPPNYLRKKTFVFRAVRFPDFLFYRIHQGFGFFTTIADRNPTVQKTQNDCDSRKQRTERFLRCTPSIGVHGHWRKMRRNLPEFFCKHAVFFGKVALRSTKLK